MDGRWEFWIDRGGTFTDVVARRPDGSLVAHKLLSASPKYRVAAVAGILIPLTLEKMGHDPAVSSVVFLTTVTDCVGYFSFLGLATVLILSHH